MTAMTMLTNLNIFRLKNYILILLTTLAISCKNKTKTSPSHDGEVFVKVRSVKVDDGWGYEIFSDTTIYVKQYYIPVIQGRIPFPSEESALKTGTLVLQKLTKNQDPALDSMELVNLKVLK